MEEVLVRLFSNLHFSEMVMAIFATATTSFVFANFFKRKEADRHLADLLKNEKVYVESRFKELTEENQKQLSQLMTKNVSQEYDFKAIEIKKQLLEQELQMLKLEILKQKISLLTKQLNEKERSEILDAIDQPSIDGQINYLNSILRQSGDTSNTIIRIEK